MQESLVEFDGTAVISSKEAMIQDLLEYNRKRGNARINTICMMVLQARQELEQLARESGFCLAAEAQEDKVVPPQKGVDHLWNHRFLKPDDTWKELPTFAKCADRVCSKFIFDRFRAVSAFDQFPYGFRFVFVHDSFIIGWRKVSRLPQPQIRTNDKWLT